eukprot:5350905-Pyramimonas_sp.AAC.1
MGRFVILSSPQPHVRGRSVRRDQLIAGGLADLHIIGELGDGPAPVLVVDCVPAADLCEGGPVVPEPLKHHHERRCGLLELRGHASDV